MASRVLLGLAALSSEQDLYPAAAGFRGHRQVARVLRESAASSMLIRLTPRPVGAVSAVPD